MRVPEILQSKKAQAFFAVVIVVLLGEGRLSPEQIEKIVAAGITYILGQAYADGGKERAKIESETLGVRP